MYALLNGADMLSLRHARLLELERTHYKTSLQLAEMDALEVPADAPGRRQLEHDLATVELTIEWHRECLGFEPISAPRVEARGDASTRDDEADRKLPVGEEAPA